MSPLRAKPHPSFTQTSRSGHPTSGRASAARPSLGDVSHDPAARRPRRTPLRKLIKQGKLIKLAVAALFAALCLGVATPAIAASTAGAAATSMLTESVSSVPNGATITFSYSTPAATVNSTNWIGRPGAPGGQRAAAQAVTRYPATRPPGRAARRGVVLGCLV
jgi:hypothetical protein